MSEEEKYSSTETLISRLRDQTESEGDPLHPLEETATQFLLCLTIDYMKASREAEAKLYRINRENSDLRLRNAILKEKWDFHTRNSIIKGLVPIALGISGTLIFSEGPVLSKVGMCLTPFFLILFLVSCYGSLRRGET